MTQNDTNNGDATMEVKVTSKDFKYAVSFLKKKGYKFHPGTATWSGPVGGDIEWLRDEGYVEQIVYWTPSTK